MVTCKQVRKLMALLGRGDPLDRAALRADMDPKTARKYRDSGILPGERPDGRGYRTRRDPFDAVQEEIVEWIRDNPGLQAKTLFEYFQRRDAGRFQDGQLRTMQRRFREWKALVGPHGDVKFAQEHRPGELSASDFTHMDKLGVTIGGMLFEHMVYHFVLTYSNWESVTICFSESFESFATGFQNALFGLGGSPRVHRTDNLTAVRPVEGGRGVFTKNYKGLLRHYGMEAQTIEPGQPHQNGDAEQSHRRLKEAVGQALILRGSRDFESREEYSRWLLELVRGRNLGRSERLVEETPHLRALPETRILEEQRFEMTVGSGSTIRVAHNTYSVDSRLVGYKVLVYLYSERVDVYLKGRRVAGMPRLRGRFGRRIDYRHIIDSLCRKPGAFQSYKYREEMFPTSHFRMAYDALSRAYPMRASQQYLGVLRLAAYEGQERVERVLGALLPAGTVPTLEVVEAKLKAQENADQPRVREPWVEPVDLGSYDALLDGSGEAL